MSKPDRRRSGLFQTGLSGLFALLILIGGLLWGQRINPFVKYQNINVQFESAAGLGNGDSVYLNGMVVGSVNDLTLQTDGVMLTLRLPLDLPLTDDALFQIGSLDLMGGHAVFVQNGSGAPFQNSDKPRQGVLLPGTGELLAEAKTLIVNLDRLMGKLSALLPAGDEPLPFRQLADEIVLLTVEARQLLHDFQIDQQRIADGLSTVLADTDSLLLETRAPLRELLTNSNDGMSALQNLIADLQLMLEQPGTLNKLASDSTLYVATLSAVVELDSLLEAIGEHGLFRFHKKRD
jgi:ABC-type transporter Mla subunit MlaD